MILGLGTDVVETARVSGALERYGAKFAARVLADVELARFADMSRSRQVEFVAGRFAAKEAVAKAIGCGIGRLGMPTVAVNVGQGGLELCWISPPCGSRRDEGVKESGTLSADRRLELARHGVWHISITHTASVAFAVAIWEQTGANLSDFAVL